MKPATYMALFCFVIVVFVLCPIVWIWSINTLFGTSIPFTLKTWLAGHLITAPLWLPYNSKRNSQ